MIGLIFTILIIFSIVWILVWLWFFKSGKSFGRKVRKAVGTAFELGNYKKAKELLLRMPDLDTNPEVKYKLGLAHLKLNDYDEAKVCFEEVIKKAPKDFEALFHLAQVFQFQKKYEQALETYNKAIKENNKDIKCPLNIGNIYYEQGNYDEALTVLEKAKEIAPENVELLFSIVKCKSELCDIDDNESCNQIIDEYLKIAGNEELPAGFDASFGKFYAKTGQIEEALEYCRNAIESNEKDIETYRLLGLMQLIKKDFAGAKNSLSMALNFQTSNMETHNLFSYLLCSHEKGCELQKCRKKYYELIKKYLKE